MREEWIKELYQNGFTPVKGTDFKVWECTFITSVDRMSDIVARMLWTPKRCTSSDDEWTLEFIFAGNGHMLYELASATFYDCMCAVSAGPMQNEAVYTYIEGYCAGIGRTWIPTYSKADSVQEPPKDAHRCSWDLAKERLTAEGWKDTGCPNLEYQSAYCGLSYTIRATMDDNGRFSVNLWGDPDAALGCINLTLDDVSAMGKKTLYELLPTYVENCAELLRKKVLEKGSCCSCPSQPGVPDEWLARLSEDGWSRSDPHITAMKTITPVSGKSFRVKLQLKNPNRVNVEIVPKDWNEPLVAFGTCCKNLDEALERARKWIAGKEEEYVKCK